MIDYETYVRIRNLFTRVLRIKWVWLFCIFKNFLAILISFHSVNRKNHLMILKFLRLSCDSEALVAGTMPFSYRS